MLDVVVLAPIPVPGVMTAISTNPGERRSDLMAKRRSPRIAVLLSISMSERLFCPQCFSGADSRGVSRGDVAGDLGDGDEQDGGADQDGNTAHLHAGEGRRQESGYAEGAEQAEGAAD